MKKEAILCVDDESILLLSLKQTLQMHLGNEYRYETALNAEQAWKIIETLVKEQVKIIVIISDWLMPGIKGDEFLIQVHKKYPEIKAIMITGQTTQETYDKYRDWETVRKSTRLNSSHSGEARMPSSA